MKKNKQRSYSEMAIVNLATSAIAWGWPLLLAFATTPMILKGLGNDAYGIRGLVFSITGYFALLDMGLNGAVTKYLAEYHAQNDEPLITELLGTTLTTFTVFGFLGGALIFVLAEWFTVNIFTIPPAFHSQAILAFRLTGAGFFLSMITWWGSSIPTGLHRFDVFNGISMGFGTITTLGTLVAVLMGYGLVGVIIANLFSNVIAIIAYFVAIRRLLPNITIRFSFDSEMFKRTVMFGLYMVAFRIFGLLFAQLDSLLIGMWIGTTALTFYILPQQISLSVHGINAKMMQIVFPLVSEFSAKGDSQKLERIFYRGFNLSLVIGLSAALPLAVVGKPLLRYWISPELEQQSTVVLELLILTYFLYGITALTTSFISGLNYPKFVTLGSLVSGIFGLLFYLLLIKPFGLTGVALGKLFSVVLTVVYYLVICSWRGEISTLPLLKISFRPIGIGLVVGALVYFLVTPLIKSLLGVFLVLVMTFAIFCSACWFLCVFDNEEKQSLKQLFKRVIPVLNL